MAHYGDDPDPEDLDQEPRLNFPVGGLVVMVCGLVSLFASGIYFDQFGKSLIFDNPGTYLFFGSIWLGIFGLAWTFFSARTAARVTVIVAGIYLAIFFAGKLSRGEI